MTEHASDVVFTAAVKAVQERLGSRAAMQRMAATRDFQVRIGADLAAFLAERDSAYLATASAEGQPYIQHRGGPKGFLRVLDDTTLGFADFDGNRQYITLGNLSENPKAALFVMDYPTRRRIKLWGTARVVEDDAELVARLRHPDCPADPRRAIVFAVAAWDVNCQQHITPRHDEDTIARALHKVMAENAALKAELARLNSTEIKSEIKRDSPS